jgi:integrase
MVYKRNGYWHTYIRYSYTDDEGVPRSKRIRKKISTLKSEATVAEGMIRAQIAAGNYDPRPPVIVEAPRLFVDLVADEFLPWSKMQHSPAHHEQLKRVLLGRIGGAFAGLTLHEITTKRITDFMQQRRRQRFKTHGGHKQKPTSAATVNRELAAIKVVFRQAIAWGRVTASPASGVSSLKEPPNPPRLLSGAEVARLLAAMPDHLVAAVGVAVYAGLRRAEILRLQWSHVDLKARVMTVAQSKTNKSRKVPISADLAELLRRHPRTLGQRLLFPATDGTTRHDFRTALHSAGKRAGLEKIGMHQLRHAFCSHSLMQGTDARTVMGWMGHSSLATTLRYAHVSQDHEQAAIERVRYVDDEQAEKAG